MRNSKKIVASVLSLATLISVASCGSGGGRTTTAAPDNGNGDPAVTTTTAATTTETITNDTFPALQEAVAALDIDNSFEVTKKLKWLAWYPIDETSATWEAFKRFYGIPEEGDEKYGDAANLITVYTNTSYDARYDKLGNMIAAGDSPDLFQFEIRYFPISAIRNMFQPVDDIVDTYAPEYESTRELMDKLMWNNKNYCVIAPEDYECGTYLWYRRSIMQEYGFDDPYELYKSGNWTWDNFTDMLRTFKDNGDDLRPLTGWYIQEGIIASSGVPVIGIEDGKLVSHLNDPALERAMNFLEEMVRQEFIDWDLKDGATNDRQMATEYGQGKVLFYNQGIWFYSGTDVQYVQKKLGVDFDDMMYVPWPRDPQTDGYYAELKNNSYMFVSGSQNPEGFKAYCACRLAISNDPAVKYNQNEKDKLDFGVTDEILNVAQEYKTAFKPIFNFMTGISARMATDYDSAVWQVISWPAKSPDYHFTEQRAEFEGQINADIAEANSSLG